MRHCMAKPMNPALAVLALTIVAAMVISGCTEKPGEAGHADERREISAFVNGVSVYADEVDSEYSTLTPEQQAMLTKADALSFLIEREILYRESVKERVVVSDEEAAAGYEQFLAANNVTETELATANVSAEKVKSALRKQLQIDKLLDAKVPKNFVIKRKDVEAVYNSSIFASRGISIEQAEKGIVDLLTAQRQQAARDGYIAALKDEADVLIVSVPR